RPVAGPLTTIWTPPGECDRVFSRYYESGTLGAQAYNYDCDGPQSCYPSDAVNQHFILGHMYAFYSPGLSCPSGWSTAAIVSHGMKNLIEAQDILATLSTDETAAVCCPSGFDLAFYETCALAMTQGLFSYWTCSGTESIFSSVVTVTVGQTITVDLPSRPHLESFTSTHSLVSLGTAVIHVFPILLIWRSIDRPSWPEPTSALKTTTAATATATTMSTKGSIPPPPTHSRLSTGGIVGVSIGAVLFVTVLVVGARSWLRKRKQTQSNHEHTTIAEISADMTQTRAEL
ncbi:hypothetical protein QBC35DRAFT_364068, partial [Podospora australis]